MQHNKRPFANLGNIITSHQQSFKRGRESPNHQKNKNFKPENDENSCVYDPTRTIENKIKNIQISSNKGPPKQSNNVVAIKNRKDTKKQNIGWSGNYYETPKSIPTNVIDHDKTKLNQIDSEPYYAFEIFEYLKEREKHFQCRKYMKDQKEISERMRMVLIDWLVEVQQTFELNHETLYLAVKIIDHYLMSRSITCSRLQLLGITAIFIASKLDERIYPMIDDLVYMSDDAYGRDDIIRMEIDILKTLDFEINYPLSYSFLRRYARCSMQTVETLYLSRYILETSLLHYSVIDELDSKMAAASLLLAIKMKNLSWNETLEFYTGYKEHDLIDLARRLNQIIKSPSRYETIRDKYQASVFLSVAHIPPLENI